MSAENIKHFNFKKPKVTFSVVCLACSSKQAFESAFNLVETEFTHLEQLKLK